MEDPIEYLHQGATAWNDYVTSDAGSLPVLRETSLSGGIYENYTFKGLDFSKSSFRGATLINCDFSNANLFDVDLTGAKIEDSDFFEASVTVARLSSSEIKNSSFLRADLIGSEFRDSRLEYVDLRYSRLEDTDFTNAYLKECKVYGCSAWSTKGRLDDRSEFILTPEYESEIVAKDLGLAQYFYLMNKRGIVNMHNVRIYDPILREKKEKLDFHLFISHASEDKEAFVRPLAKMLDSLGLKIWYDEFSLSAGDSLRTKIDDGLSRSMLGVVILSHAFFQKSWPKAELNAIFNLDLAKGKYLIPIWHQISQEDILRYSPLLADRIAIVNNGDFNDMAIRILKLINEITTVRNTD